MVTWLVNGDKEIPTMTNKIERTCIQECEVCFEWVAEIFHVSCTNQSLVTIFYTFRSGVNINSFDGNINKFKEKTFQMFARWSRSLKIVANGYGRAKPVNEDIVPLPNIKSVAAGEDSYFLSLKDNKFGISDGVGAWRVSNNAKGNSAFVSEKLLHYCAEYKDDNIIQLMNRSYQQTLQDMYKLNVKGSATILLGQLINNTLHIASLGDCQILIYRKKELVFKSQEQYHFFNCPFQLGTNSITTPSDSQFVKFPVEVGDVFVAGSDGLFDNLWDEDIAKILFKHKNDLKRCCKALVDEAMNKSVDPSYDESPFQLKAGEEGLYHIGGKLDDTTAIIGEIVE